MPNTSEGDTYHVIPVGDLKEHNSDGKLCHCKPRLEKEGDGWVVIHNAYDGREFFEELETFGH